MNVLKLKGKVVENNFTIEKIAENLGIDRSTLYRKLNDNGDNITIKQANIIVKLLKLSSQETISIFFEQIKDF